MSFYHEKNIAHRDIKPDNIMIDIKSPGCPTKLIDFGFAAQSVGKMQIFCGTPAYMSPEICNSEKYDGPATDVWAAGILLYTILFGQNPFKAPNEKELYKKIAKGVFTMPSQTSFEGRVMFENFRDIRHVETIKSLIHDLLQLKESKRLKASQILVKYKSWFD